MAMKVSPTGVGTLYNVRNSWCVLAVVFLLQLPPTDQRSYKSDLSAFERSGSVGRLLWLD